MANEHDTTLDQRESIQVDEFLVDRKWQDADIKGNWLDPKEQYKRPKYTLSYNGVPFAPLGGLHGLTGQPGHGKTFTFTQLMVAILRGDFYGLHYMLRDDIPNPKVLYIDTEMEKGNTQLVMLRVYEMMGWEEGSIHDNFRILWLREEIKSEDRWRKVLKAIQVMQPTVVFLDGLIDVIGDFNDNKECQQVIYECMATASHYGISLWCLLHENPGTTKMVGHAGSFLERKATDVLQTKKDKTAGSVTFKVSQNKARARDLEEWQFTIEDGNNQYGCPVLSATTKEDNDDKSNVLSIESVKDYMKDILDAITWPATRDQIFDALTTKCLITNRNNQNEVLQKAKNRGWLKLDHKEGKVSFWTNEVDPF